MSELALQLIQEARRTRATVLDLGNCGLTEVPETLFEIVWLEELILGSRWLEFSFEKNGFEEYLSSNHGPRNDLKTLGNGWNRLVKIKKLIVSGNQISDLSPLANLINLKSIEYRSNQISDLSPLANLNNLQSISCGSNQISDLSPLANLNNLQSISCGSNQISDLSPLANLINLQSISCGNNQISDLSPLANLINLQSINCGNNQISDLSPLANLINLQSISCSSNQISDLSPLANLINLQSISCGNNQISDLSPLANLINLQSISCSSNQISDLSPLANLINLQSINCGNNQISDLSPLANLINLQSIDCGSNQISDLSPLANLINLQSINCWRNQISDLSPLANLINLQSINCWRNQISDLSPLANLINLQSISCISNQISDLSPLANLINLQSISCGRNQISDLSPLANLINLQSISCGNNQISDLSPLANLINLQSINCGNNQISDLSPLANLINLQSISCISNQISDLSPLANLINLQSIDCGSNQISDLSPLANLINLQSINCWRNQISDLSPLANLINLQSINCGNNQISDLSPLANLINLQSISCGSNQISDLSPLANLINLQSISCISNQISDLSPLANLINLQSIDCGSNQISDLSPLANLINLQSINCWRNQISDLSPLANLINLQSINCWRNQISDLSLLANLINLQSIDCGSNQISDLSPLANLINLQSIDCGRNQISDLSPLANLINLQSIDCGSNQISDLSPLANLINLQSIECGRNQISDLSPLANLINLQSINCSSNQITSLEPLLPLVKKNSSISQLFNDLVLSNIFINNCPITIPPIEIIKKGNQDFVRWFEERDRARAQGATVHLLEAKCLILGEGGAGKTTLARKLMDAAAPLPQERETTKGIDVQKLELLLHDGKNVQVHIWDFGGQEIYHATHQFFLTKRSLYILLDDTRKDDRTLHDPVFNYWLQVVELYGGGSPLLIIQNEKDDRSKGIDLDGMRGRFGFIQNCLASNLATNRGLQEIKETIKDCIQHLPHIGEEQPLAWLEVRQGLEQLSGSEGKDYIPVETYLNICKAHGIEEQERAMFLSSYLHDLGVFLHFQDDPVLQHTLILNNAWATAAVYRLLDDEPVKKNNGRFTEEDLQRVWHEPTYAGQHRQLLALMERFELCYKLPGQGEDTWLATQLLPVARPAQLDWPVKPDTHFRFEYVFLPKGLLSNHIVRMNKLVKNPNLAWRTGVILEQEGAKALVTETYGGREIKVQGVGKVSDKLINQIYQDFSAMHARFDGLKVRTMLPCICDTCQNLSEPQYYDLEDLKTRLVRGKFTIECRESFKDVSVEQLLNRFLTADEVSLLNVDVFNKYDIFKEIKMIHNEINFLEKNIKKQPKKK